MVEQIKDPVSDECHIIVSHSAFIYFIIVFLVFSLSYAGGHSKDLDSS